MFYLQQEMNNCESEPGGESEEYMQQGLQEEFPGQKITGLVEGVGS